MGIREQEVVVDCLDPARLARFWGAVLGTRWASRDEDWAVVDADPLLLAFQRVPEPKQSPKNRLHLDIRVRDAELAALRAERLGAHRTGGGELDARGDGYLVLRDPEENEFCFVVDERGGWDASIRRALDAAPAPRHVWHLTTVAAWRDGLAAGSYRLSTAGGLSVDDIGFVHAVYPAQLPDVARAHYSDLVGDLCVLVLDVDTIAADGFTVRDEDGGDGVSYPHVYGAVDPSWVVDVRPAAFDATGRLVVSD